MGVTTAATTQPRHATQADIGQIVHILRNFHAVGGFDFPFDAAWLSRTVQHYIKDSASVCFVIGAPVSGVLMASYGESLIAPFRFAQELLIWIEPAARGASWLELRNAYEDWARLNSCRKIKFSAQQTIKPQAMARLLRRGGYHPCETVFYKDI